MQELIKAKAIELLENGTVDRVLGWKAGEFFYDLTPAVFTTREEIDKDFVYSVFSGANFSKYLVKESRKEGKVAAFLKPCDTYSFNQLLKEHRILRENVHVVGIACDGMCDIDKLRAAGAKGILGVERDGENLNVHTLYGDRTVKKADMLAERCLCCKSHKLAVFDEKLGEDGEVEDNAARFSQVAKLEAMTPDERFEFWRGELSRCIRCNACRDVCPACTCEKCVFDNDKSGIANKGAANSFEEKMYHIIRAFHVAGRCTDCGECSRVCPEHIPLHLLNRKFIKDIDELYGEYQSGADTETRPPLMDYRQDDADPSVVYARGGKRE